MSTVTVFYHRFTKCIGEGDLYRKLSLLPSSMARKILRYRKPEDRHRSLYGKLLLLEGLETLGYAERLADLSYNERQRPFFEGSGFDFNISHAGNMVICGFVDKGEIGIDVEKMRDINLEDYEFIFDADTFRQLRQAANLNPAFFDAWTIREAVLKAQGGGFAEDARQITYSNGVAHFKGKEWWIKPIPSLDMQYIVNLATSIPITQLKLYKLGK